MSYSSQSLTQLETLKRTGDRVYLRLFSAKNTPLDVELKRGMAWTTPEGKTNSVIIDGIPNY